MREPAVLGLQAVVPGGDVAVTRGEVGQFVVSHRIASAGPYGEADVNQRGDAKQQWKKTNQATHRWGSLGLWTSAEISAGRVRTVSGPALRRSSAI